MRVKKKYQGVSSHRYADNPMEKRFALAWQEQNEYGRVLDYLLYPPEHGSVSSPRAAVAEKKHEVAATVIQWLGSPMGQLFLAHVLQEQGLKELLDRIDTARSR